ncbi:MAG: glutamine-hydrolyzing GMP synthase [Patescibacteria group bacterium]
MLLLVDFGSQTAHLIARRLREFGETVAIGEPHEAYRLARQRKPAGIVFSGGPASVYEPGAPKVDPQIFDLDIPILGICYGLQLMSYLLGGKVIPSPKKEFGPATLKIKGNTPLFNELPKTLRVWMSHGDKVVTPPSGFTSVGSTETIRHAAIINDSKRIYGIQFHPEVIHTQHGADILKNFLVKVCKLQVKNFDKTKLKHQNVKEFIAEKVARIRSEVGNKSALCALSGGVDSAVAATLVHRAIGHRLTCIYIDSGLMRAGETEQIRKTFRGKFKLSVKVVRAASLFLKRLKGVIDPEQKRKIIGKTFIDVFEEEAKKIKNIDFLVQGTIYPDVIESRGTKHADKIKTHHNVAGLPQSMKLKLVEPLRELYKDEVRQVGEALDLPKDMVWRQPFPGPGLAIRIIGEVTHEKLELLRKADTIIQEELKDYRDSLWQAFAILTGVNTTGVRGDARSYGETIAVRAIEARDAMSAHWSRLPYAVLDKISTRIVNEIPEVNRVVYDITNKPPGTMEWE